MKKVININFQGRVVPIEENAYEILKQYVDSLRQHFAVEEGKEEIINDIESRIAELFAETLKKGSTCITDEDVENIIKSMGRPEDFDDEEGRVKSQLGGEQEKTSSQQSYTNTNRRLYRDENNRVFGGVCSGVANYFGIEPLVVRILAAITFGFSFVPYLVLWIAVPSSATKVIGSTRKRLFRDMDDKFIGGVASGLSHYFGINVWIARALFFVPFLSFVAHFNRWEFFGFPHVLSLSFSPGATIIYIILWILVPEAITSADKLEMKGERVDLNSIKNTIQTDMEGFKGRAEKFGTDIRERAQGLGKDLSPKAQKFADEVVYVAKRNSLGLGGVIALIAKVFAYFILAIVLFSIVISLFAGGVACIGLSPLFNFVLGDGVETALAWAGIMLFIWIPIVGIIIWIIRRLTKAKGKSALVRYTFLSLWLIGLFCFISLLVSLRNDFRYKNAAVEEMVGLTNPKVDKLEVKITGYNSMVKDKNWFSIEPFESFDNDTVFVPNTDIRIVKSTTDSFSVTVVRVSNGSSKIEANELANKITYSITQKDSVLALYKGIPINTTDKFRNQRVIITIAVPMGKRIKVDDKIAWKNNVRIGVNGNDWDWQRDFFNTDDLNWESNKEYIMTEKGLKEVGKKFDSSDDENSYDKDESIEENQQKLEELRQDSVENQHEMDEKKREIQRQLDYKQRQLDEKKRELKLNVDTSGLKAKSQKIVAAPKKEKNQFKEIDNGLTPSFINTI